MTTKIWTKIAFTCLLLGWFAFMWVSIYASWNRKLGLIVALVGLCLCVFGSMMMLPIIRDNDLFNSIDKLDEARRKYYEATERLNKKIKEL
jgi:hypothetical protein